MTNNNLPKGFADFVGKEQLFSPGKRILIAASGGLDSTVLCHLAKHAGWPFAIAHCNFQLRGEESNGDEAFVIDLAKELGVEVFTTSFDTLAYASTHKCSIQVAARNLRYEWFESIRVQHKFDCIATAHHLNDNIETILFNLAKGTGIKGLRGILPKHGSIIRPLLYAERTALENFAVENQIAYREDSSNASDKYSRNFIRQNIVPLFHAINPSFEQAFANNIQIFRELEQQFDEQLRKLSKRVFFKRGNATYISIAGLQSLPNKRSMLFAFLQPYGFNTTQVDEVLQDLNGKVGRQFHSDSYRLIQDRKFLILSDKEEKELAQYFIFESTEKIQTPDFILHIHNSAEKDATPNKQPTVETVDAAKLEYPLILRRWKPGDYFYPIGMNNKKKKVKKFLTDIKLPLHEKEKVWVIESNQRLVWVVGYRLDERFKLTDKTNLPLTFNQVLDGK